MGDDFVLAGGFHRREAEQAGVIADAARDFGFRDRLSCWTREARDQRERALGPGGGRLGGELQLRAVETDVADGELRGVDADGQPACAGIDVIARQRALMHGVELAAGIERERMGGKPRAVGDQAPHLGFNLAVVHGKYPYPNSGPATANGRCADWPRTWPNRMR